MLPNLFVTIYIMTVFDLNLREKFWDSFRFLFVVIFLFWLSWFLTLLRCLPYIYLLWWVNVNNPSSLRGLVIYTNSSLVSSWLLRNCYYIQQTTLSYNAPTRCFEKKSIVTTWITNIFECCHSSTPAKFYIYKRCFPWL